MDNKLLQIASRRAPRYTSYPTAAQFTDAVDRDSAQNWLSELPAALPVSLYLHVPFCRKVCWYCACNMKLAARSAPVEAYADDLVRELELVAEALPARMSLAHLHWGGGTPTSMPGAKLSAVMQRVRSLFDVLPDAETAFELDPRTFEPAMAEMLAALGTNRVSLGVQEFDPAVQAAVNRIQPFESVQQTLRALRSNGIERINFDLMYGLPYQSVATISRTIEQTVTLRPDRIALFGYAHVPWMAKRQRQIPEDALPGAQARFEQAETAARLLVEAGYLRIGLDHFARPGDPLIAAERDGRLIRNFQGYSDSPVETVIGVGATAISCLPRGYYQNIAETGAWARSTGEGHLPVHRGVGVSAEDELRRRIIFDLMCHMEADIGAVLAAHGREPAELDTEIAESHAFAKDGLLEIEGRHLRVTERGRTALRVIAAVFDTHLKSATGARHSAAI